MRPLALLSLIVSLCPAVLSADYTWKAPATSANWQTTSNWSPSSVPGAASTNYADTIYYTTALSPSQGDFGSSGIGTLGTGGRYLNGIVVQGTSALNNGKGQFYILNSYSGVYLRVHSGGITITNPSSGNPADFGCAQLRLAADQSWSIDAGRILFLGSNTIDSGSLTIEGAAPRVVTLKGDGEVVLGNALQVSNIDTGIQFVFAEAGKNPAFNMGGKAITNAMTIAHAGTLSGAANYAGKLTMLEGTTLTLPNTSIKVGEEWDIGDDTGIILYSSTLDVSSHRITSPDITASGNSGIKGNNPAGPLELKDNTYFVVEDRNLALNQFSSIGSNVTIELKNSTFDMSTTPPDVNLVISGECSLSGSGIFNGNITINDGGSLDIQGDIVIRETNLVLSNLHISSIDGTSQPGAVDPLPGNFGIQSINIVFDSSLIRKLGKLEGEHTYTINLRPGATRLELVNMPDIVKDYSYNQATGILTLKTDVPPIPPLPPVTGSRPNIIFVLVDDMGWGDLGINWTNRERNGRDVDRANSFATPTLDQFAREGVQLRRHYTAAPVCAPARASLMLGVHQGHSRTVRNNSFDEPIENSHTLASVLKKAGYSTAAVGKWGIGGDNTNAPAAPQKRGFEFFYGIMDHISGHYHYLGNNRDIFEYDGNEASPQMRNVKDTVKDTAYSTDLFTGRAKRWIMDQQARTPEKPFFMYLAYTAPHASLVLPNCPYPEGGGRNGGVQWKESGSVNTEDIPPTPGGSAPQRDGYLHPDNAGFGTAAARRHSSMIRRVDDALADIIQLLKDLEIDENTLIVFTSDNGPHNEGGSGESFEGRPAQNPAFFKSYGMMDGIKRDCWEAGIRVPTIVRWPAYVPEGGISFHACQFHDWMATFAAAAGVPVPARSDGVSLLPTLVDRPEYQRESNIYIEYDYGSNGSNYADFLPSHRSTSRRQQQVVFLNGYKGVRSDTTSINTDFKIFDTENDPQESTDLAPSMTQLHLEMKARSARVRREGVNTNRPYGKDLIPAVTPSNPTVTGLKWKTYHQSFDWVPDFRQLGIPDETGTSPGLNPQVSTAVHKGIEMSGYLEIPEDGEYEFYLQTDANEGSKAFVHLHDMQLIDADFTYVSGSEADSSTTIGTTYSNAAKSKMYLKVGKHPIRIGYIGSSSDAALSMSWKGPNISKEVIPGEQFSYEPELMAQPSSITLDRKSAPVQTATVIAESDWVASSQADWIKLVNSSGTGNGTLSFSWALNLTSLPRTGYIDIDSNGQRVSIKVTQQSMLMPYHEWSEEYFGSDHGNPGTGMKDSYSKDGHDNLLKYALGLDPKKAYGSLGIPEIIEKDGSDYLRLTYPFNMLASDIEYRGEASDDLKTWDGNIPVQFDYDQKKLYIDDTRPVIREGGKKRFLRLKVSEAPAPDGE